VSTRARAFRLAALELRVSKKSVSRVMAQLPYPLRGGHHVLQENTQRAAEDFMAALLEFDQVLSELRRAIVRVVPEPPKGSSG